MNQSTVSRKIAFGAALVLCLILMGLMLLFRKKKAFHGEVVLWYLGGYGLIRFIIEGIRVDRLLIPGTNLAVSQCLSLGLLIFSV